MKGMKGRMKKKELPSVFTLRLDTYDLMLILWCICLITYNLILETVFMYNNINLYGLLLGTIAFVTIGISHPVVAKAEYYYGRKIWWAFFLAGIIFSLASLFVDSVLVSVILGTIGFSSFWSTHEIFKQHKRVMLGRAKRNPNRLYECSILLLLLISWNTLNYSGVIIGAATFTIIAISRYACIKAEYYFSKRFWIGFLIIGIGSIAGSAFTEHLILSVILGINGFTFLWGIGEIIEQEERVKKGWFPKKER